MSIVTVQIDADATIEARTGISHGGYVMIRSVNQELTLAAMSTKTLRALACALAEVADKQDAIAQHLAQAAEVAR